MFFYLSAVFISYLNTEPLVCHPSKALRHIPNPSESKKHRLNTKTYDYLRLQLELSPFQELADTHMCKSVNQTISWAEGEFTCGQFDLLTITKSTILRDTLEYIELFISSIAKVVRLPSPIELNSLTEFNLTIPQKSQKYVDLHVTIAVRPYGRTDIAAQAIPLQRSIYDGRIIQGLIFINPAAIPNHASSEIGIDRTYFLAIFHQFFHILGVGFEPEEYLNLRENSRYGSSIPIEHSTLPGFPNKHITTISTPQLSEYAIDRFGKNAFQSQIGHVEITFTSNPLLFHPVGRLFYGEMMLSELISPAIISDLSFTMLEDTGYYHVEYKYAEPLPWGDGRSRIATSYGSEGFSLFVSYNNLKRSFITSNEEVGKITNFTTSPPQQSFPRDYLAYDLFNSCSYDFRSLTRPEVVNLSVMEKNSVYYDSLNKDFYNPLNLDYVGSRQSFDYIPLKIPYLDCFDQSYSIINDENSINYYGSGSICLMSSLTKSKEPQTLQPGCFKVSCDTVTRLRIYINEMTFLCKHENETIEIPGFNGSIQCPDPLLVCSVMLFNIHQFHKKFKFQINSLDWVEAFLIIAVLILTVTLIILLIVSLMRKIVERTLGHDRDLSQATTFTIEAETIDDFIGNLMI